MPTLEECIRVLGDNMQAEEYANFEQTHGIDSSADCQPVSFDPHNTEAYKTANELRREIKAIAARVLSEWDKLQEEKYQNQDCESSGFGEVCANAELAYRHLEDASMRLGKVLQHLDGGISVYDRSTTVGA